VYTNATYQGISGLTEEQMLEEHWIVAIHPEDRDLVISAWQDSTPNQAPFRHEVRFLRQDGSVRWARLHIAALDDGAGEYSGYVHTVEDITDRREAEDALRAAEEALFEQSERAQVTLDSIGDAVLTTDRLGRVTYLNRAAEKLTGWPHDSAAGRPLADVFNVIDSDTRRQAANPAQRAIAKDKTVELALGCVLIRPDGTELAIEDSAAPIHDRHGGIRGAVIVFHEASQSRVITAQMAHMARHDFLTGLPNRVLFRDRLTQAIALARRHDKFVGMLYLDLDNFKQVNDSLGHEKGDRLLRAVGDRLRTCVRATDTVCREGGDEFVVLLAELEHPGDANRVAEKVHTAFELPLLVDGRALRVTMSIGISLFPRDGDSADALVRKADTAMYKAKVDGPGESRYSAATASAMRSRQTDSGPTFPESRP